jgi:ribosomal protein L6P/L9E
MAASFTDGRFEVQWQTAQTAKGASLVAGYVHNTRGGGVANIRMQVETLDAQGQVIGTASALVPGYVGGFSRVHFEVPIEKTGVGYRVSVLGWDPAGNGQ